MYQGQGRSVNQALEISICYDIVIIKYFNWKNQEI